MRSFKQQALATLLTTAALVAPTANAETGGSLGVGLGIPYGGVFGVAYNHTVTDSLDLTASIGSAYGTGWNLGGKYFFGDGEDGFRVSAFYGTNGAVEVKECYYSYYYSSCSEEVENFTGLTAGIGWGHRAYASGWNFDLMIVITSGVFDEVDRLEDEGYEDVSGNTSRVALSGGYHWAF